ncbi:MAG: hypothetical protein KBD78_04915 [Oligoflexales bacterium]|nr:hypothetical protein [Oligoflexales bacterium]
MLKNFIKLNLLTFAFSSLALSQTGNVANHFECESRENPKFPNPTILYLTADTSSSTGNPTFTIIVTDKEGKIVQYMATPHYPLSTIELPYGTMFNTVGIENGDGETIHFSVVLPTQLIVADNDEINFGEVLIMRNYSSPNLQVSAPARAIYMFLNCKASSVKY